MIEWLIDWISEKGPFVTWLDLALLTAGVALVLVVAVVFGKDEDH